MTNQTTTLRPAVTANSRPRGSQPTGRVVRRSGDKTIAVAVSRVQVHPLYRKRRLSSKVYLAHDESNALMVGETVRLTSSRPRSRRKRWVATAATVKQAVPRT